MKKNIYKLLKYLKDFIAYIISFIILGVISTVFFTTFILLMGIIVAPVYLFIRLLILNVYIKEKFIKISKKLGLKWKSKV